MRWCGTISIVTCVAAIAPSAADAETYSSPGSEASCMLDDLSPPVRQALVAAMANEAGPRAERLERVRIAFEENTAAVRAAGQACIAKFEWSIPQQDSAIQAFQYGIRLEASIVRLHANGLSEQTASEMFEALPADMHTGIFHQRDLRPGETQLLQAEFEKLVGKELDGPGGNALSEYITARAAFLYYSRELESR